VLVAEMRGKPEDQSRQGISRRLRTRANQQVKADAGPRGSFPAASPGEKMKTEMKRLNLILSRFFHGKDFPGPASGAEGYFVTV